MLSYFSQWINFVIQLLNWYVLSSLSLPLKTHFFSSLLTQYFKQSQSSLSDGRTLDLLDLLQQDRSHVDRSTPQQQTFYRTQAESAIGTDENMYRIAWTSKQQSLSLQLLGKDALSTDDVVMAEKEWATYVDNFVLSETTSNPEIQPFLRRQVLFFFFRFFISKHQLMTFLSCVYRNLRKATAHYPETNSYPENVIMRSSLQCKICMRSYRLFFVPLTEDFIYRKQAIEVPSSDAASKRFNLWLEKREAALLEKEVTIEVAAKEVDVVVKI